MFIRRDGVGSLTEDELAEACVARGILAAGVPAIELQRKLEAWTRISTDVSVFMIQIKGVSCSKLYNTYIHNCLNSFSRQCDNFHPCCTMRWPSVMWRTSLPRPCDDVF